MQLDLVENTIQAFFNRWRIDRRQHILVCICYLVMHYLWLSWKTANFHALAFLTEWGAAHLITFIQVDLSLIFLNGAVAIHWGVDLKLEYLIFLLSIVFGINRLSKTFLWKDNFSRSVYPDCLDRFWLRIFLWENAILDNLGVTFAQKKFMIIGKVLFVSDTSKRLRSRSGKIRLSSDIFKITKMIDFFGHLARKKSWI